MEKKRTPVLIGFILGLSLLFVGAANAVASDFVCGSHIVTVGERRYDILNKCGTPSHVESWEEVRIRRWDVAPWVLTPARRSEWPSLYTNELVTIEEWEYNLGPNRFIRYLRFENGRLTKVTTGDYGY